LQFLIFSDLVLDLDVRKNRGRHKEKSLFSKFNRLYEEFTNEHKQSIIIVDFVPTAENLCNWFVKIFDRMKTIGLIPVKIQLSKIRFYEIQKAYVELIL